MKCNRHSFQTIKNISTSATNEVHPGEQHFYQLPVNGGKAERITTMTGANQISISPDEKYISVLYSYATNPGNYIFRKINQAVKCSR